GHDRPPASPAPQCPPRHADTAALARSPRPDRRAAGGDGRARLPAAVLALHRRDWRLRGVQSVSPCALPRQRAAVACARRLAARSRPRRARSAALSHWRTPKPFLIPVPRPGADLGDGAPAAPDPDACSLRGVVRHTPGVSALSAALVER